MAHDGERTKRKTVASDGMGFFNGKKRLPDRVSQMHGEDIQK